MNFVPVTTCTDLLRPGGYARLIRYLENLGARDARAGRVEHPGFRAAVPGAGEATCTPPACSTRRSWWPKPRPIRATRWERNKGVPRKIGSKLWLYDCINCDKCVPVCPNDANFVYETPPGPSLRQFRTAARRAVAPRARRRAAAREGAPVGQLCRRLQRLRQLRRLLSRGRRPARREAALLRQPGDLPEACRRATASISIRAAAARFTARSAGKPYTLTLGRRRGPACFDDGGRRSRDSAQRQRSR